jgi:hypothetical protein
MLDTLALVASLALADSVPVAIAYPPAPARPVLVARLEESEPESLTTCYQGRSGSCWTEE